MYTRRRWMLAGRVAAWTPHVSSGSLGRPLEEAAAAMVAGVAKRALAMVQGSRARAREKCTCPVSALGMSAPLLPRSRQTVAPVRLLLFG